MVRTTGYAILGAIITLALGLYFSVGQWIGSGSMSFIFTLAVGAILGGLIAHFMNKK
jgi:hypothetical protein